jgi:hypothetical protein
MAERNKRQQADRTTEVWLPVIIGFICLILAVGIALGQGRQLSPLHSESHGKSSETREVLSGNER